MGWARHSITPAIVREKEEGFVFLYRPTDREAKLVLMFGRPDDGKKASGIEHSVAEVFKTRTVKLVFSGFDCVVLGALALKLDAGAAGLNLELFHRLD